MIPEDFKALLPKVAKDTRPYQYLFVYDPEEDHVHLAPVHHDMKIPPFHKEMREHIHHPDTVEGHAIAIKNGWRICDSELGEVDPYIKNQVLKALRGEHPAPPLPSIRYHGSPINHVSKTPEESIQQSAIEYLHDYQPTDPAFSHVDDDGQVSPKS